MFAISFKTALKAVLTDVLPEEGCKPWFDRYDAVKGLARAWFEGPQEQEKVIVVAPERPDTVTSFRELRMSAKSFKTRA